MRRAGRGPAVHAKPNGFGKVLCQIAALGTQALKVRGQLTEPTATAQVSSILRHPPFVRFWLARIASSLSFQMLAVAVGWRIYALTNSAFDLGLVGLAQFVPMVLLMLLVGPVADRYDRRLIAGICQVVEGVAAAVLAVGTIRGFLGRDGIYAAVAVIGAARAFESPALAALLPDLLTRGLVERGSAWSASASQTAQIVGPAVGGGLYVLGPAMVFAVAAGLLLAAAVLLARIRMAPVPPTRASITWRSFSAGLAFVWGDPPILGTVSLDLFAVLLGGVTALLPIFARDILMTGPWGLGLLRAAPACGALAMSVYLAHRPLWTPTGPTMFGAVIMFGAATIMFALSTNFGLSLAALVVLGAADVVSVVIRFSLVQLRTPQEMRGRVSAVNALFIGTSNQLGEFESGLTAALFGTVPAALLGGIGTIAVAVLWMRLFPQLTALRSLEQQNEIH
jgi:MFS family permease